MHQAGKMLKYQVRIKLKNCEPVVTLGTFIITSTNCQDAMS